MQVTNNSHPAPQSATPPAKDHTPPPDKTEHAKPHHHRHMCKHVDKSA